MIRVKQYNNEKQKFKLWKNKYFLMKLCVVFVSLALFSYEFYFCFHKIYKHINIFDFDTNYVYIEKQIK
jgi:hypothetical protein